MHPHLDLLFAPRSRQDGVTLVDLHVVAREPFGKAHLLRHKRILDVVQILVVVPQPRRYPVQKGREVAGALDLLEEVAGKGGKKLGLEDSDVVCVPIVLF